MRLVSFGMLSSVFLVSTPVAAQVAGNWRVSGNVAGNAFTTDCVFTETGQMLSGVCTDVSAASDKSKPGKRHVITRGRYQGADVGWTYPVKVMMMSVDLVFAGKRAGASITGTIFVKGRTGVFTARRE